MSLSLSLSLSLLYISCRDHRIYKGRWTTRANACLAMNHTYAYYLLLRIPFHVPESKIIDSKFLCYPILISLSRFHERKEKGNCRGGGGRSATTYFISINRKFSRKLIVFRVQVYFRYKYD